MKDLSIKDCEIIYGGIAPFLWWAGAGIASYVGTKLYHPTTSILVYAAR